MVPSPGDRDQDKRQEKKIPELPKAEALQPYDLPILPKGAHQKHLAPNMCLQSALFGMVRRGRRRYLEKKRIISFSGVAVYFTGGELDQGDLDVFLHAVHLAARQSGQTAGKGLVQFSVRGYLKALGKKPGKSGQEWLLNSIRRLSACVVEVHFGDWKRPGFGSMYGGSLIYDFYYDSYRREYYLRVNSDLESLFSMGWTQLQWRQRLQLKTGLSKWLHGLYSSAEIYPMRVETLLVLSRSRCGRLSDFRRTLKRSLDELQAIGTIKSWRIDRHDKVFVTRKNRAYER